MRIPRFFLYGKDLENFRQCRNNQVGAGMQIIESDLVHRIRSVLRLGKGDAVTLLDDSGQQYQCVIVDINKQCVLLTLTQSLLAGAKQQIPVTIAQSVIKGERFDWCLEKLTGLGVATIVPLLSERGVVHPGGAAGMHNQERFTAKLNRWRALVREAAEQCERPTEPTVSAPTSSLAYLACAQGDDRSYIRCICLERSDAPSLLSAVESRLNKTTAGGAQISDENICKAPILEISIVIGPEGGFTNTEISMAAKHGWQTVSLGRRILRSETAGMYAMAQIASLLD